MSGLTLEELVTRTGHPRRYMRNALLAMEAEGSVRALPDGSYVLAEALDPELAEALEVAETLARLSSQRTADGSSSGHLDGPSPLGWARRRIAEVAA